MCLGVFSAGEKTESDEEMERFGRIRITAEISSLARTTRLVKSLAQKMPRPSIGPPFSLFVVGIFEGYR